MLFNKIVHFFPNCLAVPFLIFSQPRLTINKIDNIHRSVIMRFKAGLLKSENDT